jgi:hypothetical protein
VQPGRTPDHDYDDDYDHAWSRTCGALCSAACMVVALASAACDPQGPGTGTFVALLGDSDIISTVDHFRVWVFDRAVQGCSGDTVADPRAPALVSSGAVGRDDTARLSVPAGERTFYAEAYATPETGELVATGCTQRRLSPDEQATVVIRLAGAGVDGGDADADADGDADDGAGGDEWGEAAPDDADGDSFDPGDAPDGPEEPDDADVRDEAPDEADAGGPIYYSTTFLSVDCARWTRLPLLGENDWQCQTRDGVPAAGHDAAGGVLATRVLGNYSNRSDCFAESPAIDPSAGAGPLRLVFWHWMETESYDSDCAGTSADYDGGMVEVSVRDHGFTHDGVAPFGGYPYEALYAYFDGGPSHVDGLPGFSCRSGDPLPPEPDVAWERECFDLTAFRAPDLRVRFYFGSDGMGTARGWYIDEFTVEDGACP